MLFIQIYNKRYDAKILRKSPKSLEISDLSYDANEILWHIARVQCLESDSLPPIYIDKAFNKLIQPHFVIFIQYLLFYHGCSFFWLS